MILTGVRALEGEEWRPVVGYEGKYLVSSQGRVYSIPRWGVSGGLLKPQRCLAGLHQGYLKVVLYDAPRYRTARTYRLVAEAFLPDRQEGSVVRHLNGDGSDNRVENLAWGTVSENNFDTVRHGTHHEARKTHCSRGHEYNEENTYITLGDGKRDCRICHNAHKRKSRSVRRDCPDCGKSMRPDSILRHRRESCPLSDLAQVGVVLNVGMRSA